MLLPFLDSVVCIYANPPWTLIGQVLEKVSKEWSRVLMVAPYWKDALWYELLVEPNGRSCDWRGKLYVTEGGHLRQIPTWFTLFSLVVGRRQRLT